MSSAFTIRSTIGKLVSSPDAGRVEIDHVQRLGALVLPVARQLHRIVAEDGDVVEVTAAQAYRLTSLDVDGGEHDHEVRAS